MDLTYSLKPVLPADVERRLNEPPPKAISGFLAEPYVACSRSKSSTIGSTGS